MTKRIALLSMAHLFAGFFCQSTKQYMGKFINNKVRKMKKVLLMVIFAFTCGVVLTSCHSDMEETKNITSKGLTLWWNHQIFSEQGRGYIFDFSEVKRSENLYRLNFEYQIDNNHKSIEISLISQTDKGKCPQYPEGGWVDDGLCSSRGTLFIPENLINEGNYKFIVKTMNYKIQSEIIFTKEKATLVISENNYFSSEIKDVFITPKDLLYGGISFKGEDLSKFAYDFMDDIRSLGLNDTIVSNPPFNLDIDETGKPRITVWQDDNYYIQFLFSMTSQFSTIFELAKVHFSKSPINIYLFSSNGDQAKLDNMNGIYVWYASARKEE